MAKAHSTYEVTIVGAGIAGCAAALRLLERGFKVTLIEQDNFIGGKWGTHPNNSGDLQPQEYHEHCYHMILNWFHNLWDLFTELGVEDKLEPIHNLNYFRRGQFPRVWKFSDVGTAGTALPNIFSGVLSPANAFIYFVSMLDIQAQPVQRGKFLDYFSVNAFMHSRPYMTDQAAIQHQRTLAKAFAASSYLTSFNSYKHFVEFGSRLPVPMIWLLKGNTWECFFEPLLNRLKSFGDNFELKKLHQVTNIHLDGETNRVNGLTLQPLKHSPTIQLLPENTTKQRKKLKPTDVTGDLLVTVPVGNLAKLIDADILRAAPSLGAVKLARAEPMASLDVHFNKKLSGLPKEPVVLMSSNYELTFIDNSQIWPGFTTTHLNVVASESHPLDGLPNGCRETLNLKKPATAVDFIIKELKAYIDFDEIDIESIYIQSNVGEKLFLNESGSWQLRPKAETDIPNLYIAGDFCQTPIDVVTIEGATISGLMAAEAIRRKAGLGRPIEWKTPASYPDVFSTIAKTLLTPYALAAKAWVMATEGSGSDD